MNNLNANESSLGMVIAGCLLQQYEKMGIQLKFEFSESDCANNYDLDAIEEESETRAKKIFHEFQTGGKVDKRDYINLNDLQIVNKFIESRNESIMSL